MDGYKQKRIVKELRSGLLIVVDKNGKTQHFQPVPPKSTTKLQKQNATPKRKLVKKPLEQMVAEMPKCVVKLNRLRFDAEKTRITPKVRLENDLSIVKLVGKNGPISISISTDFLFNLSSFLSFPVVAPNQISPYKLPDMRTPADNFLRIRSANQTIILEKKIWLPFISMFMRMHLSVTDDTSNTGDSGALAIGGPQHEIDLPKISLLLQMFQRLFLTDGTNNTGNSGTFAIESKIGDSQHEISIQHDDLNAYEFDDIQHEIGLQHETSDDADNDYDADNSDSSSSDWGSPLSPETFNANMLKLLKGGASRQLFE